MSGTATPKALTVAEAAQRAQDARTRLDTLTDAVVSGDPSIHLDELNEARAAAEFAELQLQGAQNRARREAEEQLRADVAAFSQAYPARLAAAFGEVAGYRQKAVQAVGDLLDAVREFDREREAVRIEFVQLRPPDVSLGNDADLPAWYADASPSDDHRIPSMDETKSALAVAVEAIKARHRGAWRSDQGELMRNLDAFVSAHETSYHDAVKRLGRP